MNTLEYRQARAGIRDTAARCLDHLDALHGAMARGQVLEALDHARQLALAADDLTALHERVLRLVDRAQRDS